LSVDSPQRSTMIPRALQVALPLQKYPSSPLLEARRFYGNLARAITRTKLMKVLSLPIVSGLRALVSAAPNRVDALLRERLRSYVPPGGQHSALAPEQIRGFGSSLSGFSAHPMATTPIVSLPPPPTQLGFQAAPHGSSGITPAASESTTRYLTALGDFDSNTQTEAASVVERQPTTQELQ